MTFPNIDPVFLRLGPLEFRWYGLMYIIGFISAYFIIANGARRRRLPLNKEDRGRGIFIIKSFMDKVNYHKICDGNVLEMSKKLH